MGNVSEQFAENGLKVSRREVETVLRKKFAQEAFFGGGIELVLTLFEKRLLIRIISCTFGKDVFLVFLFNCSLNVFEQSF